MDERYASKIVDTASQQTREWFSIQYDLAKKFYNIDREAYICPKKKQCQLRNYTVHLNNFQFTKEKNSLGENDEIINRECEFFYNGACMYYGSVNNLYMPGAWGIRNGGNKLYEIFSVVRPPYSNLSELHFTNTVIGKKESRQPGGRNWCGIFAAWLWKNAGVEGVCWDTNRNCQNLEAKYMVGVNEQGKVVKSLNYNRYNPLDDETLDEEMRIIIQSKLKNGPDVGDIAHIENPPKRCKTHNWCPENCQEKQLGNLNHFCIITKAYKGENNKTVRVETISGNSDYQGIKKDKIRKVGGKVENSVDYYFTVIDVNYEYFKLYKELAFASRDNALSMDAVFYMEERSYQEIYQSFKKENDRLQNPENDNWLQDYMNEEKEKEKLKNAEGISDDLEPQTSKFDQFQNF